MRERTAPRCGAGVPGPFARVERAPCRGDRPRHVGVVSDVHALDLAAVERVDDGARLAGGSGRPCAVDEEAGHGHRPRWRRRRPRASRQVLRPPARGRPGVTGAAGPSRRRSRSLYRVGPRRRSGSAPRPRHPRRDAAGGVESAAVTRDLRTGRREAIGRAVDVDRGDDRVAVEHRRRDGADPHVELLADPGVPVGTDAREACPQRRRRR